MSDLTVKTNIIGRTQRDGRPVRAISVTAVGSGGGGGGVTPTGDTVTLITTAFNVLLSAAEDTVQKAFDKLDDHTHAQYITAVTKAMVEAVLTGNITSHTHSQYLTAITKAMVEAVLTGAITSHTHSITKAQVEAVLTGNITSHTHDQYLTAITKAQVEAVLTGVISTHSHATNSEITNATRNNTPSTIVKRDTDGSFASGTHEITGDIVIKNSSAVTKWTLHLGASDVLEFKNASGTVVLSLSQAGFLKAKDDSSAFATI